MVMLRDGQFIREDPVRIGAFYTPTMKSEATPEEHFIQGVLLKDTQQRPSVGSLLLRFVLGL